MRIYDTVRRGQLSDRAHVDFAAEIATHDDKEICITVERKRKKRSLNQNSYYWGVVVPMCQDLLLSYGNDVDQEETHSFLKEHVGKLTASVIDKGTRKAIVKSSASLSTAEFEDYIARVTVWAATEGVIIPSPNQELEEYKEKQIAH